jgi:hypothetical protein
MFTVANPNSGGAFMFPAKSIAYIEHDRKTNDLSVFLCFGGHKFKTVVTCTPEALATSLEWVIEPRIEFVNPDMKVICFLRHVRYMTTEPLAPAADARRPPNQLKAEETTKVKTQLCMGHDVMQFTSDPSAKDGSIARYKTYLSQAGACCWG